ncbi:MAG: L-threonylcarbamoyladenylate synthase [Anaerovoracaceae bacterium]|jgi:L-threonylcarbamoyladenylate synthase
METKIYKITDPEKDRDKIAEAAEILKNGGLVAFPTDTVYAVGALLSQEKAIEKIFEVKNRPKDNPLGILVARDLDMHLVADVTAPNTQVASDFIEKFWPGPLTLVMPRLEYRVPAAALAGRDTVGVRQPDNAIAQALIYECEEPLVAPSANISGHPSPTTGQHVIDDLGGKIDMILVGEDCPVGIESTILDLSHDHPVILRKGAIPKEELQTVSPWKIMEVPE